MQRAHASILSGDFGDYNFFDIGNRYPYTRKLLVPLTHTALVVPSHHGYHGGPVAYVPFVSSPSFYLSIYPHGTFSGTYNPQIEFRNRVNAYAKENPHLSDLNMRLPVHAPKITIRRPLHVRRNARQIGTYADKNEAYP
ncbi:hypothetical protein RB195_015823 [Necator americanus]